MRDRFDVQLRRENGTIVITIIDGHTGETVEHDSRPLFDGELPEDLFTICSRLNIVGWHFKRVCQ